jgi:hypothetical protein
MFRQSDSKKGSLAMTVTACWWNVLATKQKCTKETVLHVLYHILTVSLPPVAAKGHYYPQPCR